jgi:LmbE family N-acetylglucosaminyl deacetylase
LAADAPPPPAAVLEELRDFSEMGSVLHVAAHPDDENTQLLTYLALGRHLRTGYLSLTRGDGGQNLLGPEFGERLGVIRTQELLAARRLDGAQQFFTRAIDFGFSKSVAHTMKTWGHDEVLGDVVRVIRTFRPDVIVTRFSTVPGTTHAHHTASAVLALEAYKLAGDPAAYPEQLGTLAPWKPKRIVMNSGGFGRAPAEGALRIDIGGTDPVSGDSFAAIAARSRAMHKTQGFGNFGGGGGGGNRGPRMEAFQLLDGEPASKDLLDGVDTTWARVPDGAEIGQLTAKAIADFNPHDLAASVPALLAIRSRLAALPADPLLPEKKRRLDKILCECLGLSVRTEVPQPNAVPGEVLKLHHVATVTSAVPVRWVAVRYPGAAGQSTQVLDLRPNEPVTRDAERRLPVDAPLSQPYWLREDHAPGLFTVSDPSLIGRAENPPAYPIEQVFEVGGQTLVVPDEPVPQAVASEKGQRRRLDVIAPVSIDFASDVRLFAPGGERAVEVELTAARPGAAGTLRLDVPAGWKVSPTESTFRLANAGDHAKFPFTVTAPAAPAVANIAAHVEVDGVRYASRHEEIRYDHIPFQALAPQARVKAVSLELAIRGRHVGYLPGAGDSVARSLGEMGYSVTTLTGADLTPERLKAFDAVVIGVRAFNVHTDLAAQFPALLAYVEGGGTVVAQYNTPNGLKSPQLGPYELKLSGDLPRNRVTEPAATVTLLAPHHPVFTSPNRITAADFDGWVQERGLNFPSDWDHEHWTELLACGDAGGPPLRSGLLVARYGKGYYVYTGLSWFRQLPAGVPGAYRIFANLVSLGK